MGLEDLRKNRPKPPMEWFTALGYKDRGILAVGVNEQFTGLADRQVGYRYSNLIWVILRRGWV